ncbi:hypothetical protein D3C75_819100 [compost metagenome]
MHAARYVAQLAIGFDVVEQVHAKVVEPQICDRNARFQVFQLDDFFLQAAQLLLAVGHIVGLGAKHIVVARGGDVGNHHPALDAFLEVDVLVERDVGPVIDQLDAAVGRSDAIHSTEALDDAHGVPVDVVVDEVVTVLQVLALGDAVGANQQVDLSRFVGQDNGLFFGARREEGEQLLEVVAFLLSCVF